MVYSTCCFAVIVFMQSRQTGTECDNYTPLNRMNYMNVYVTTSLQNVIWYTITFNMVMYRLYMLHLPPPVDICHHGDTVPCVSVKVIGVVPMDHVPLPLTDTVVSQIRHTLRVLVMKPSENFSSTVVVVEPHQSPGGHRTPGCVHVRRVWSAAHRFGLGGCVRLI